MKIVYNETMQPAKEQATTLDILRVFGGSLILLGLIFALAGLFNQADTQDFVNGYQVEGTVMNIWEGDSPGIEISFIDRNGRSQTQFVEKTTEASRAGLTIGAPVVALQIRRNEL